MASRDPEAFILKNGSEIILRCCAASDAAAFIPFQKQIASETTFTLQTKDNPPSVEKTAERFLQSQENPRHLRIGAFLEKQMIGQFFFYTDDSSHPWTLHIGRFGMMILKEFWGQGIAKRMLEILEDHARLTQFTRIEAHVRVQNERGVQLYQRAGYQIEGIRKHSALIDGIYWDEYSISKLLDGAVQIGPTLKTDRLRLRLPVLADIPNLLQYSQENDSHLFQTSPEKSENFFTPSYWSNLIALSHYEFESDRAVRFVLFSKDTDTIVGTVNFSQIFRGPFQACYLGYALAKSAERKGLMTEALKTAVDYIFNEKNIHRIMANYLPDNFRSAQVLQRLGFQIEGKANHYLYMHGAWREHVLTSLTHPNWKPAQ